MISRDNLSIYLNQYLACHDYNDFSPNGVQVEGRDEIRTICSAVTASQDAIEQAIAYNADALIVHHGYFWRGESPVIVGMKRKRLADLLSNDINLFAYHLPLDCHLSIGNNAEIGRLLSIKNINTHKVSGVSNLLWSGDLTCEMTISSLSSALHKVFNRKPFSISSSINKIQKIAWCSGGAQDYIEDAARLGVDAFISGEVSERTYYQAKELGINYFACGHHATERFGIQALGSHLCDEFSLVHKFIDSENPV